MELRIEHDKELAEATTRSALERFSGTYIVSPACLPGAISSQDGEASENKQKESMEDSEPIYTTLSEYD